MIAEGEVSFAVLGDQEVIARFRTIHTQQPPHSMSDPESTDWELTLNGRGFKVLGATDQGRSPTVPISSRWTRGEEAPLLATMVEPGRYLVHYKYFYGHHLGWLYGPVTLTFDTDNMTVDVVDDLEFEAD